MGTAVYFGNTQNQTGRLITISGYTTLLDSYFTYSTTQPFGGEFVTFKTLFRSPIAGESMYYDLLNEQGVVLTDSATGGNRCAILSGSTSGICQLNLNAPFPSGKYKFRVNYAAGYDSNGKATNWMSVNSPLFGFKL